MHPGYEESLCVHDEIFLEAPVETTDEVALTLKKTMERRVWLQDGGEGNGTIQTIHSATF